MRTKALVMAAILAASLTASLADNVYSLNIVGYVNKDFKAGSWIYNNPLDLDGVNNAANVLSSITDYSYLTLYIAGVYQTWYYEDDGAGGKWWEDSSLSTPKAPPNLPPGTGFWVNVTGTPFTQTFVGSTIPAPASTSTVTMIAGNQLVGSRLPVGGSVDQAIWGFPKADYMYVLKWTGVYQTTYGEDDGAGGFWWTDSSLSTPAPAPDFDLAEGFFINYTGTVPSWSQTLP